MNTKCTTSEYWPDTGNSLLQALIESPNCPGFAVKRGFSPLRLEGAGGSAPPALCRSREREAKLRDQRKWPRSEKLRSARNPSDGHIEIDVIEHGVASI